MQNKQLHILIVASWYKTEANPTQGSFIEEQARMLQKHGHKVTVLHPYLKGSFLETLSQRKTSTSSFDDEGIITISIGVAPVFPKLQKLNYRKLNNVCNIQFNRYINEHGKPDIIHSHAMFMGGIVGDFLSKKHNLPHFITEHTSGLIFNPNDYTTFDRISLKQVYASSFLTFFVSKFALEEISREFNLVETKKLQVLHNIVNDHFFEQHVTNNQTNKISKFISISNLVERKNINLLIDAWQKVHSINSNCTLTIAGSGHLKSVLTQKVSDLQLEDSITFLPGLSRNDVINEILKHDALVSSSKLETFGLTVAEAISLGKPVVTTDSGGVRDIVTEFNGLICSHDHNSLANSINHLVLHSEKFEAIKIKEEAFRKFSESIIYSLLFPKYIESVSEKKF